MRWLFAADLEDGFISDPLDISDVWPASFSNNTNEIVWGAKFAARCPWISCVVRLSSYECGMDQAHEHAGSAHRGGFGDAVLQVRRSGRDQAGGQRRHQDGDGATLSRRAVQIHHPAKAGAALAGMSIDEYGSGVA